MYPLAIALMGKAASDKMRQDDQDQIDREANRQWQNEERAFTRSQRARMVTEQQRQDAERSAVIEASKPVVPTSGQIGDVGGEDEEGNPLAPNPTAGTFMVGGQRFADRTAADAAAVKANAPAMVSERAARAMMSHGNLQGAQALRTGARQEQVADLQLSQAQLADERDRGLREVGRLILSGGWASVPTVYDKYRDGAKAAVKEDGKGGATITYAGADGQTIGSKTYKTLVEFFADVEGGFNPTKWFDYQNNKADKDRLQANWEKEFSLRQDAESRRATHEARMLTMAERTARAAEGKANAGGDEFDRNTATAIAKEAVTKEADLAAKEGKPMSAVAMAERVDDIVSSMLQTHINRVTISTVKRELSLAQGDPAAYATVYAKAARVLPQAMLVAMGFKNPNAAPPAAPGTPAATIQQAPPGGVTFQGGKWVQQAPSPMAGPTPAPGQPEAPTVAGLTPDQAALATQVDTARGAATAARQRFLSWGSRQKASDPKGFAQVEAEYRRSQMAETDALAAYQRAVTAPRARMVPYAQP